MTSTKRFQNWTRKFFRTNSDKFFQFEIKILSNKEIIQNVTLQKTNFHSQFKQNLFFNNEIVKISLKHILIKKFPLHNFNETLYYHWLRLFHWVIWNKEELHHQHDGMNVWKDMIKAVIQLFHYNTHDWMRDKNG